MAGKKSAQTTYIMLLSGLAICLIMWFMTPPEGFTANGWRVLALLIPTIMVWASEAMPVGVASLWFLSFCVIFKLVPAGQAFSGFGNHLTWLMFGAFSLGVAMEQTGLSKRMSYYLLSRAKGLWGIVFAAYAANFCMLAIPSSAARSGILAPILNSIMDSVDRPVNSNFARFLSYMFCMCTNLFIGILVLTSGASNGVMLGLYAEFAGNSLTWMQWFMGMIIPTIVICSILTASAYILGGRPEPEITEKLKNNTGLQAAYKELGDMTFNEKKVIVAFVAAVLLWATGDLTGVSAGFMALLVAGVMFLPGVGVLDVKALGKLNWTIILLIGAVMGMGTILNVTGLSKTLSTLIFDPILSPMYNSMGLLGVAIGVCIIGTIVHFIMPAPNNVSLMTPLLVTWGITAGLPPLAVLCFLGMLTILSDKIIFLAYQMPPYYVFLGMGVADVPRFNKLLLMIYPIGVAAVIVGTYILYAVLSILGIG